LDALLSLFSNHGLVYSATLVLLAIMADKVWTWPAKWHPVTFIQLLAKRMAERVQTPVESSFQQHCISGSLAYIVLFGPLLALLALLLEFAAYRAFFEWLLLYWILGFSHTQALFQRVFYALSKERKTLAREWLAKLVKRDTKSLSDIGVGKAAIEALVLRYFYHYVTIIALFFIGGIVLAMAYRCALECRWQWKRTEAKKDAFVLPVTLFCRLAQWLPCAISITLLKIAIWPRNTAEDGRKSVKVTKPNVSFWNIAPFALHTFGRKLGIALSGPVFYQGIKLTYPRLGAPYQVRLSDMQATETLLTLLTTLIVFIILLLVAITVYLSQ